MRAENLKKKNKNLFCLAAIFFLTNRMGGLLGGAEGQIHNSLKIKNLRQNDPFGVAVM
jgi:hypothetical protein